MQSTRTVMARTWTGGDVAELAPGGAILWAFFLATLLAVVGLTYLGANGAGVDAPAQIDVTD